jgi:hypothetical protein
MPIYDENGHDLTDMIVSLGYDKELVAQAQTVRLTQIIDQEDDIKHDSPSHYAYVGNLAVRINCDGTTEIVRLKEHQQASGGLLQYFQSVVDGLIEPMEMSLDGIPEDHPEHRSKDDDRLPLTVWVNEEFVYQRDDNGDLLPINPWAMKLLEKGDQHVLPRGDVIVTSGHVDDDGNTGGLDWRAATAVATMIACCHAYIGDGTDDNKIYDCREYKITPLEAECPDSENFYEVFKVAPWGEGTVTDEDLIALLEGE